MTYLTGEQITQLLQPINPRRVSQRDGLSHVEAYDIRAHLTRIFGFGRWSADLVDLTMLYEHPTQTKNGKPAFTTAYRATVRLTICAPDGTQLATYTEAATGDATMPDYKRADAADFAIKTAESQAFKRAAVNLGDQFGLSLYRKGSTGSLVMRTLVEADGVTANAEPVDHGTPDVVAEQDSPEPPSEVTTPDLPVAPAPAAPPPPAREVSALREQIGKAANLGASGKKREAAIELARIGVIIGRQGLSNTPTTTFQDAPTTLGVLLDEALKVASRGAA